MSPEFNMTDITPVEERALNHNVQLASQKKDTLLQKARNIVRGKGKDANPYAHVVESVQVKPEQEKMSYATTFLEFAAPAAVPFMLGHLDNADKPMIQEYQKSIDVPSVVCFEMDSSGNLICNNQFEAVDVEVNGNVVGTVVRKARQAVTGNIIDGGQPTGGVQSIGTETPTGREQEQNKGFFPLLTTELDIPLKSVSELKAMSPEEQSQYIADIQNALFVEDGLIEKYADIVRTTLLPTLPDSVSEADFVNALQIKVFFAEKDGITVATAVLFLDQNHNNQPENYFLKSSDPLEYNGATTDVYAGIPNEGTNVSVGQVNATGDIVIVESSPKSDTVYVVGGTLNHLGRASMIPMPATEVTARNGFVLTVQLAANPTGGAPDELAKVELDGVPVDFSTSAETGYSVPRSEVSFDNPSDPNIIYIDGQSYPVEQGLSLDWYDGIDPRYTSRPGAFFAPDVTGRDVQVGKLATVIVGTFVKSGTEIVRVNDASGAPLDTMLEFIDVAVLQNGQVYYVRSYSIPGSYLQGSSDGNSYGGVTMSDARQQLLPGNSVLLGTSTPYSSTQEEIEAGKKYYGSNWEPDGAFYLWRDIVETGMGYDDHARIVINSGSKNDETLIILPVTSICYYGFPS